MPHHPRKRFGQNFLHDPSIIQRIIDSIAPQTNEHLVEIGPGKGAITRLLLPRCRLLDAIELDRDLVAQLHSQFSGAQFRLHNADALKFDFCSLRQPQEQLRILGNLPYNISTPLLFRLLEQAACIQDMHFMLQKEVVERMAAQPGNKTYGRLSVMMQIHCRVEPLFNIGPGAFKPAPKVDSAFVRLIPHPKPVFAIHDPHQFSQLVNQAFSHRRKTLRNTLKNWLTAEQISACGIDPNLRPEQLSLEDFVHLSNAAHHPAERL